MLIQALIFVLDNIATAFVAVLLLRFHMQVTRVSFNNPLSHFTMALTDFAVKPARRVVPGLWGLDLATLMLAWLVLCLLILLVALLKGGLVLSAVAIGSIAILALLLLVKTALGMIIILQFALFLVSVINPYSPYMSLLNTMNRPFVSRIQKIVPPVGHFDLSPMVVALLCSVLMYFVLPEIARQLGLVLM